MQTPIVSIIIPIYNVAPYLKECLDSVMAQSYENLDIILVDDGSSDESLDIALDFARRDKRIFVISKPNGGLSSARNFGLECIKGSALREFFENRDTSFVSLSQYDNVACHTNSLSCHTEGIARSISTNPQNRDSSLCASHFAQNDNTNAQYDKNTDTSVVSLPQYDNATCHTEALAEVSQNRESRDISLTLNMTNNRDTSLCASHFAQNDNTDAQYDKNTPYCHFERSEKSQYNSNPYNTFSLTQNQIAYSKYPAFVYIITNKTHTTLYIGVTSNLQKRIYEHKNHLAKGFSDKYNCEKLVYFESFDSIEQAIEKEKYLKGKKREFKENLIDSINPQWLDLSEYLFGDISALSKPQYGKENVNCHTERSEVSQLNPQKQRYFANAQYDKVGVFQYDKASPVCHTEPLKKGEVSQIQTQNRDISLSLNMTEQERDISLHATRFTQYDKERVEQYDKATRTNNKFCHTELLQESEVSQITSFAQTHTFTKTYKTITTQELDAHFTQITPHFIKSDLERINGFITQELPKDALIHFVDSDDIITKDCIQKCVARLLKGGLDIAVHNWLEYDDTTKQSTKGAYLSKLKQNEYDTGLELLAQNKIYDFYFSPQGLFRAEILNRYALRYTEGIYHEDHDFGTLLFCLAHKVAYTNEGLYVYRKRATSIINVQKQAAFPAQIPSFLEPLRGDFSDYKSLREYFRAYCFVRLGFIIWGFYEAQLSQNGGQDSEFRERYERFFSSVILGYAMKVFKIPLSKDTLGIQSMLATLKFPKILVWWHFLKDLHRQPKKLAHITNIRYLV